MSSFAKWKLAANLSLSMVGVWGAAYCMDKIYWRMDDVYDFNQKLRDIHYHSKYDIEVFQTYDLKSQRFLAAIRAMDDICDDDQRLRDFHYDSTPHHPPPKFVYQSLRTHYKAGDMRLVHLQPGKEDEKIQLRIQNMEIRNRTKYEALSYQWGNTKNPQEIEVNGYPFHVTSNLHAALKRLRNPHGIRTLWIDAICMDQNNDAELSSQLTKMHDIYELAQGVVMWLGEDNSNVDIESVQGLLRNLAALRDLDSGLYTLAEPGVQISSRVIEDLQDELNRNIKSYSLTKKIPQYPKTDRATKQADLGNVDAWRFVHDLMHRSYFERAWIIQEVVLSKRKTSIQIGGRQLSADTVFAAALSIASNPWIQDGLESSIRFSNASLARLVKLGMIAEAHKWEGRLPLGSLLDIFQGKQASEPRDHIYSLIGIATYSSKVLQATKPRFGYPAGPLRTRIVYPSRFPPKVLEAYPDEYPPPPIRMDVTLPAYSVYRNAASFIIEDEESLRLLGQVDSKAHLLHGKPAWASWVPDWSSPVPMDPLPCLPEGTYLSNFPAHEPKEDEPDSSFWVKGDSLFVYAHEADSIAAVMTLSRQDQLGKSILKLLDDHARDEACQKIARESFEALVWKILKEESLKPKPADPAEVFNHFFPNKVSENLLHAWHSPSRTFCITKKGMFLVGPAGVEVGDGLFIVERARNPLILRRFANTYSLVGDSYVYDLRKRLPEGVVWDAKKLEIR
ncbi:hypothetical protein BP6252_13033 [Coleophoma cylindrospora]|uniref:Heterokaryon incompatibility domain-containing protein n=1 Tax=Coleophoma cylindrospora TaxID=1849047 RepID=A0A3D8QDM3_9HELO|nr:hypothetical protein BP6252_13033 [Coleophoma cylindrospora]